MNNLSKWKMKLIKWLAGDEPVLLGFCISGTHLPDGIGAVYLPCDGKKYTTEELSSRGALFPIKNIKDE